LQYSVIACVVAPALVPFPLAEVDEKQTKNCSESFLAFFLVKQKGAVRQASD